MHGEYRMKKLVKNTSEPHVELVVNGEQWKHVASLDNSGPSDEVYTVTLDQSDNVKISFGDGRRGRKLPTGAKVQAKYRVGKGVEKAVEVTIDLTLTSGEEHKNEMIEVIIEPVADGINFRTFWGSRIPYKWKWIGILCRKFKRCR
jgi:hypothetical protein